MFRSLRRAGRPLLTGLLPTVLCGAVLSGAAAWGQPTVTRSAPYPLYRVGDSATLTLSTNPPQPDQPIYRWRDLNGQPEGDQPSPVGTTDAFGNYTITVDDISAVVVGRYTNERYAVGSPHHPRSAPLAFDIIATSAPIAHRPAPYPDYEVGGSGTLHLSTSPAQPDQPIYRWRYKDGLPDGPQPKLVGFTDANGRNTVTITDIPTEIVGTYTGERYAVGTSNSPRSSALAFTITEPPQAPIVHRPPPYPHYDVGGSGTLTLTTDPPQPNEPIYRWRFKDGQPDGDQPSPAGTTDANGQHSVTITDIDPGLVGTYTGERYAVGDPNNPRSAPLAFTITAPPLEAPVVDTVEPFAVPSGTVTEVTVRGRQLTADSQVGLHVNGQPTGLSVGLQVLSATADGREMRVRVDTTNTQVVDAVQFLTVDNGVGIDAQPVRFQGPGVIVDYYRPDAPRQGEAFVFSISGANLEHAEVTPPAGVMIDVQSRQPHQLSGLLFVAPDAPLGLTSIQVSGGGRTLFLPMLVGPAATAPANEKDLLAGSALAARATAAGHTVPRLYFQLGTATEAFTDTLTTAADDPTRDGSATKGSCLTIITPWAFLDESVQVVVPFDPATGVVGALATTLALGQSVVRSAYTFSLSVEASILVQWLLCPGFGFYFDDLCLQAEIQVEIPGASWARGFKNCFGPNDAENGPSDGTSDLAFLGGACALAENVDVAPGVVEATITQLACCPQTVAVEGQGISFGEAYDVFDDDVVRTTPTDCTNPRITALSFEDDHRLREDYLGFPQGFARAITDPVWVDANLDGQPEKKDAVAYTRNRPVKVNATFTLDPPPTSAMAMTIVGEAPDGIVFRKEDVPVAAGDTEVTVEITSTGVLPNATKRYEPSASGTAFVIDWSSSFDGGKATPAGTTSNELYVTLADPLVDRRHFRTVLDLAVGNGHQSVGDVGVHIWEQFGQNGGPANVTNWYGAPLTYYPQGVGFGGCTFGLTGFLTGVGAGRCGAFAELLVRVFAIQGIPVQQIDVRPPGGEDMLIKNWQFLAPTLDKEPVYKWYLDLVWEGGVYGMVPPNPLDIYGDLLSLPGVPGQNEPTPSEKAHNDHQIIEVPDEVAVRLGFHRYVDPSYGLTYFDEEDFQTKAVAGFFMETTGQPPNRRVARPVDEELNVRFCTIGGPTNCFTPDQATQSIPGASATLPQPALDLAVRRPIEDVGRRTVAEARADVGTVAAIDGDGRPRTLEARSRVVDLHHGAADPERVRVLSLFDAEHDRFWWTYEWLGHDDRSDHVADFERRFTLVTTDRSIMAMELLSPPLALWWYESTAEATSIEAGEREALAIIDRAFRSTRSLPLVRLHPIHLGYALAPDFAFDPMMPGVLASTIVDVVPTKDGWSIELAGRQGRRAVVVLDPASTEAVAAEVDMQTGGGVE